MFYIDLSLQPISPTHFFRCFPKCPLLHFDSCLANLYLNCDVYFSISHRAAVACIGGMYEKLGRMVGRSYEETVHLLIKSLRNAEVW